MSENFDIGKCRLLEEPLSPRDRGGVIRCNMAAFEARERCKEETLREWRQGVENYFKDQEVKVIAAKYRSRIIGSVFYHPIQEPKKLRKLQEKILYTSSSDKPDINLVKKSLSQKPLKQGEAVYVHNFGVDPDFQDCGVGTLLLSRTMEGLGNRARIVFTEAYVETWSSHIFQKLGFHRGLQEECKWSGQTCDMVFKYFGT